MPKKSLSGIITATARRRFDPQQAKDAWFADHEIRKRLVSFQITDNDAWDFDIENNLPIQVEITGKVTCRILARLKNNKRYVRIGVP
jgi:glucose dehydrogenase